MKRVLIDTNIILDIALKREPFFKSSAELFDLIDQKTISAYLTASTITDIYYISKRQKNHETAIQFISDILNIIDVIGIDKKVIFDALQRGMKDFEDAVQISAAAFNDIGIIITRNKADFENSGLEIYTPIEFISLIEENNDEI